MPNGGKYDGAMGVLLGLEVMQCILENGIWLRHPYEVLMFTAEEPNPFPFPLWEAAALRENTGGDAPFRHGLL